MLDADAVALDRVALTAQQRREGVDGVGGGAAELGGKVGADLDELLGAVGLLGGGHTHVGQLRADDGCHRRVLDLGEARLLGGVSGELVDLCGVLPEDGVDGTLGLLQVGGDLPQPQGSRDDGEDRDDRDRAGLLDTVGESLAGGEGAVERSDRLLCVADDAD